MWPSVEAHCLHLLEEVMPVVSSGIVTSNKVGV